MKKHLYSLSSKGKFVDKIAAISTKNAYNYFKWKYPDLIVSPKTVRDLGIATRGACNPSVEYDFPELCDNTVYKIKGAKSNDIKKVIKKSLIVRPYIELMNDEQLRRVANKKFKNNKKEKPKYKFD